MFNVSGFLHETVSGLEIRLPVAAGAMRVLTPVARIGVAVR